MTSPLSVLGRYPLRSPYFPLSTKSEERDVSAESTIILSEVSTMTTVMTNSPTTTVVAKDCVVEESSPPKYVSSQKRCAEYTPSLEELKDTTFEEYVRGEILGVPLPGYEFLYVYEDKDGREMKREVPVGQHYAGGGGEDADSVAQAVTSSDESSSRSTPPPPPPKKKVDETRTTRSQSQATPPRKKKEDEARTTRSQSQAKRGIYPASSKNNTIPSSEPPHERYRMCFHKLRDGMAKVTLPTGFWAKTDTTARGRLWGKGSKLGDMVIPSPIKQTIAGIGGVYEYTFLEQPPISVAQFRTKTDDYRKRHIGKEYDDNHSDENCDELSRKFWKRLGPTMEPSIYGADMEGTLFKDSHAYGWNVDRLESCLCLLRVDATEGDRDDKIFHLPGVTSAYLYFGCWASAFAAHNEDMNLLSINYLHAGSPKYWYAVAHEDSKRFESLAASHFSGPASECREFLRHKRCLLSPAILRKAGIKFTTCIQRPGDAIITFPGCYHFGFNTGFNVAESTNFAIPEWVPQGEEAGVCMCHPHSVRIQMKRLKDLLDSYEGDMRSREALGMPILSYSNWAKHEAKKLKKEARAYGIRKESMKEGGGEHGLNSLKLPTAYNTSIAVEITKELYIPSKTCIRKRKAKRQEINEWRLAKRVRPGLFVPNTQVICMVDCDENDDENNDSADDDVEFFIGTIRTIVDGYVKVHLTGLAKKDDMWLEQDSDHLFLDGGLTDPPESLNNNGAKGGNQKMKKVLK